MNNSKYKLVTLYNDIHKPIIIRFYKCTIINPTNITNIIINDPTIADFRIITNSKPILKLYCHNYDYQAELYEYAINYIIDNKIAKYNYLDIMKYNNNYYHSYLFFDIIDTNILLQLL